MKSGSFATDNGVSEFRHGILQNFSHQIELCRGRKRKTTEKTENPKTCKV